MIRLDGTTCWLNSLVGQNVTLNYYTAAGISKSGSGRLSHLCYTVGWICSSVQDLTVAMQLLDETHMPLPQHERDSNSYVLGRIGDHDIVVATGSTNKLGIGNAASTATTLRHSFGGIRFVLMVGTGSGVPFPEQHDLRLGDVVVGSPLDEDSGLLQLNVGTADAEVNILYIHENLPALVRASIHGLRARQAVHGNNIEPHFNKLNTLQQPDFRHPGVGNDILRAHVSVDLASTKGKSPEYPVVQRDSRRNTLPVVHYGKVASTKYPITDSSSRDDIAKKLGCICLDTSLAGLAKDFPCLVVRGISDYADAFNDTLWLGYAAMTAASYAKEFLLHLPTAQVNKEISAAAPFPLIDPYTQRVQLEDVGIRVPVNWRLAQLGKEEVAKIGWQHYYHSTAMEPFRPGLPEELELYKADFLNLATKFENARDNTENKLAKTMQKYRDVLVATVLSFPNIRQQRDVFMLMMDATDGLFTDDGETKRSLLHYLAMNNVFEVLPALVEAGFAVDAKDSDACTALHLAVASNHWESTKVLIEECGANVQARDLNLLLPWHYALHVDEGAKTQHPERLESIKKILRLLAYHTDLALVKTFIPRLILSQLKTNPDDEIDFVYARGDAAKNHFEV